MPDGGAPVLHTGETEPEGLFMAAKSEEQQAVERQMRIDKMRHKLAADKAKKEAREAKREARATARKSFFETTSAKARASLAKAKARITFKEDEGRGSKGLSRSGSERSSLRRRTIELLSYCCIDDIFGVNCFSFFWEGLLWFFVGIWGCVFRSGRGGGNGGQLELHCQYYINHFQTIM